MTQVLITIGSAVTALVAIVIALRKLYFWIWPIKIIPAYSVRFGNEGADFIQAKLINRSSSNQYVVSCNGRGTYSFKYIASRHLRHPFIAPRLYATVRYGAMVFPLMGDKPIKLEPQQIVSLSYQMHDHPLCVIHPPYFCIDVMLSSGRTIRSKKLPTPGRWRKFKQSS